MASASIIVTSALAVWLSSHSTDRSSTEALLAAGYSPSELAAAGVTQTEVRATIVNLSTSGAAARFHTALQDLDSANHELRKWRSEYLQTHSEESSSMLRVATASQHQAAAELADSTAHIKRTVEESISPAAAIKMNRCLAANYLKLPPACKFVDSTEIDPAELAALVHQKTRAVRRGESVDPAADQLILTATRGTEVREAEQNLDLLGDSIQLVFDSNLRD